MADKVPSFTTQSTTPLPCPPCDIQYDPENTTWVVACSSAGIHRLDPKTGTLTKLPMELQGNTVSAAPLPQSQMVIVTNFPHKVLFWDETGLHNVLPDIFSYPRKVRAELNKLWVVDQEQGTLHVLSRVGNQFISERKIDARKATGWYIDHISMSLNGLSIGPNGDRIAFSDNNTICTYTYIVDDKGKLLHKLDSSSVKGGKPYLLGVHIDDKDRTLICERDYNTVSVWSPSGAKLGTLTLGEEVKGPRVICVTGNTLALGWGKYPDGPYYVSLFLLKH